MPSWHGAKLKHRDNFTFTLRRRQEALVAYQFLRELARLRVTVHNVIIFATESLI